MKPSSRALVMTVMEIMESAPNQKYCMGRAAAQDAVVTSTMVFAMAEKTL